MSEYDGSVVHHDLQQCIEALESNGYIVVAPGQHLYIDGNTVDTNHPELVAQWPKVPVVQVVRTEEEYDPVPADEPTVEELDYEAETGRKAYS